MALRPLRLEPAGGVRGTAEPLCRVLGRGCDSYVWARSPGRFDWFRSHRRKPPPQPDYRSLGPRRLDGRRRGDDTEGRLRGESDLLSPTGPNRLECLWPRFVSCQAHDFRIGIGPFLGAYPEYPPKKKRVACVQIILGQKKSPYKAPQRN